MAGIALHQVAELSVTWRLGFREGDVVKSVMGRPLSPETLVEMYNASRRADVLQVVVERDGHDVELVLHVTP